MYGSRERRLRNEIRRIGARDGGMRWRSAEGNEIERSASILMSSEAVFGGDRLSDASPTKYEACGADRTAIGTIEGLEGCEVEIGRVEAGEGLVTELSWIAEAVVVEVVSLGRIEGWEIEIEAIGGREIKSEAIGGDNEGDRGLGLFCVARVDGEGEMGCVGSRWSAWYRFP